MCGSEARSKTDRAAYGPGRVSAQRAAIARAADAMPGAFTVSELAGALRARGDSAGTATVYRAVAAMAAAGHLERVGDRDGWTLYVRCDAAGHHHHLVCTGCGSIAETPCPLDPASLDAAAAAGFVVTRHEVAIYGLCADCADPRPHGRA